MEYIRLRGQDYDVVGFHDEREFEEWVRARLAWIIHGSAES